MKIETKAISIFLILMVVVAVIISYLDYLGFWIIDLLGTYLVLTYGGVSYNFAFLVPIAVGIILVLCGVVTKTQYADYALLAVGGAILLMGALSIFPVLIQPSLGLLIIPAFCYPEREKIAVKIKALKKSYL